MSDIRTQAIVLRRTNYGEADRIVQLLTPEGQLTVMAKGVRREKSKLAGGIELFAVSDVVIHHGKSDIGVLTSARLVRFYRNILTDYHRLQFGYEAIKQIARASSAVDEPEWFEVLQQVLAGLDALTLPRQLVETWFYLHVATLLGHELNFRHDVDGAPLSENERYVYDISERGLRRQANGELTADHIKFLRLVNAKPLTAVAQIGGIETILADCELVAQQHAAL